MNIPYYCIHDIDVAPKGDCVQDYIRKFSEMVDVLEQKQEALENKVNRILLG